MQPDVNGPARGPAAKTALRRRAYRASARLSHLMFAGFVVAAATPSVRGDFEVLSQSTMRPEPLLPERGAPRLLAQSAEHVGDLSPNAAAPVMAGDANDGAVVRAGDERADTVTARAADSVTVADTAADAGRDASAMKRAEPKLAGPSVEPPRVASSPIVAPIKRQAPKIVTLAAAHADHDGGSIKVAASVASEHAGELAALRKSKKFRRMRKLVGRKVVLHTRTALRAEPHPGIVVASLTDILPIVEAEPPPHRLLRVRHRGRDTRAVRPPRSERQLAGRQSRKDVKVAAIAPSAANDVQPIHSVIKGASYNLVPNWSAEEISDAKRVCGEVLATGHVVSETESSVREGACGAAAPVRVRKVGMPVVSVGSGVLLTCPMAAAFDRWMTEVVQPAALRDFGQPVTRVSASSYSCRNRYGRSLAPLSEHALINAVDLFAFTLRDGTTIKVLGDWGPVARDRSKAEKAVATAAGGKVKLASVAGKLPVPEAAASGASMLGAASLAKGNGAASKGGKAGMSKAAKAATRDKTASVPAKDAGTAAAASSTDDKPKEPTLKEKRAAFLHKVHADACMLFGTVLGPEANEAHRNHLHLDMKARRSKRGYCQ